MRRVRCISSALMAAALLWVAPLSGQAPTGTIRGRVTDSGTQQPLSGVTITAGSRGALSQADGRFAITGVPAGVQTVRTSMLGYGEGTRQVTVVAGQTVTADFTLETQAVGLNAVVVVGYGQQKAGNITGAVKQVDASQFNTGRITSPQQLIESKVAGVQVVDNNEPGGGLNIRIRGATSINASSEPLYVIDGMPIGNGAGGGLSAGRDPLNFLNPEEIESITVLKDASAAAIYGANAANGVVLITTKKGRQGTQIEYTGSVSGSQVTRLPSMLNAAQFRAAVMQHGDASKQAQLLNANTDWFSLVDRSALGQEHNLAITGAGESMNYRLSLGYMNQQGVIRGSQTERLSLGLNYDQRFFSDRLNIRTSLKGSRANDDFTPGGVLSNAAQMGPTQPTMDPTTKTGYYNWSGGLQSADNPLEILNLAADKGTTDRSIGNLQATFQLPFLSGLKATVNGGYDLAKATRKTFNPGALHRQIVQGFSGNVSGRNETQLNEVVETYLNYTGPLNVLPGNVDVTGGYSYNWFHGENPWYNLQDLSTDLLGVNGLPTAKTTQTGLIINESKLISFFGRVNYNIADKYLLAGTIRRDGSSRFGPENAWGVFPSVSAAWRISQEPFMKNLIPGLSDLKLRASWGKTGNQAFANYQQYATYTVGDAQTQAQLGNEFVTTLRPNAFDPNIKWEATSSYDFGLDYGFLDQRFSGALDFYQKKTTDLIFTVGVPAGTNLADMMTTNIGSMRNQGFEGTLSARILDGGKRGLSWTADFNAAANRNELLTINPIAGPGQMILTGLISGGVGNTIQVLTPGKPINSFYTCQQAFDQGKPLENKYRALKGDSVVTGCGANARRASHDPAPKWILGHTSSFGYRNFDASFTLRSYLGNYVYNNIASSLGTYSEVTRGSPFNLHSSVLKTGFTGQELLSDYYVEDGSFLRMDNATIGYSFTYAGRPVRAFATVQNAFTMTGYTGVDPTAGLNGLDNNIYPRSRTFTGGLSVRF